MEHFKLLWNDIREESHKAKFWLELGGLVGLLVYVGLTYEMWSQAKVQTRVQREAYVEAQRPWIKEEVSTEGDWTFEKGGEAQFRGTITLKNIGHSPAIGVEVLEKVVTPGGQDVFLTPRKAQEEMCEAVRRQTTDPNKVPGVAILFPDQQTSPISFSTSIPKEWMDAGSFTFPNTGGKYITPILVGCVDYRFSFAPGEHHQTGFVYHIGRYKPAEPTHYFAIQLGQNLPIDSLKIDRYFFGGHYAD